MRSGWISRSLTSKLSLQASDASMQPIHGIESTFEPSHPAAERLTIRRELQSLPILAPRLRRIDCWFRCGAEHAPTYLVHAWPSLIDWAADCCW